MRNIKLPFFPILVGNEEHWHFHHDKINLATSKTIIRFDIQRQVGSKNHLVDVSHGNLNKDMSAKCSAPILS
jgi:hypothetical protein